MLQICNKNNIYISKIVEMSIQILFIFSFLTIFFFMYVIKIEKEEFKHQMEYIIDTFMNDILNDILNNKRLNNIDNIKNIDNIDNVNIVLNGIIEITKEKIKNDSENIVKEVQEINKKIIKKAYKSVIIFTVIIILFILMFLLLGYCLNLRYDIKEAFIIMIFVGITELIFLKIIASKYISANPNAVKRDLTKSIMVWINKNK